MTNTRNILTSHSCEALITYYKAYERLKRNFKISFHELIELVEMRAKQKESRSNKINSIKNQLQHKGYIERIKKKYEITSIGWNCLSAYSKNLTYICTENSNEFQNLTEI